MSVRRRLLLALVVVAVVGAAVAAPTAAREPPRAACAVCTDALDDAAAAAGVALESGDSTMVVTVAENGSTRWTARVTLASGADRLTNDSLRSAVVADAMNRGRPAATPEAVSSRLDGDVLVVGYRDTDAAEAEVGVLLFTAFRASDPVGPFVGGGEGTVSVGADELVVRGPEGYAVSGRYGDAAVTADAVRWTGSDAGESTIDRSTVVAFVPDGAWFPRVRATLARLLVGL
jgi:hypothetical protein